ncbi:helix-turn-helix domain-containing protein [Dickeya dianthicola]|uniref:helix-turn-helix domain-containing protein n=1 Tax=Dickeya dianthicola TaxID=204039 RepID=UPI0030165B5C
MFRLSQTDFFETNRPISVQPRSPQEPFPEHCHSFHELVLVKSGCAIHLTDGRAVHISRGSVFYLGEDDSHMFDNMQNLCLTNVLFRPDEFHNAAGLKKILTESCHPAGSGVLLSHRQQQQSELLLTQIGEENDKQDAHSSLMVEALLSQLAVLLYRAQHQQHGLSETERDDRERLMALINHINENYREDIDWNELSAWFGIPMRTLSRRIQEHTGLTPNNYLGRIRLCQASWLLSHTQKSVTDIAFQCGFNDGNYFSSKFNQAFNMTPLQYRKRYK